MPSCDEPISSLTPLSATGTVRFMAGSVTYDTVDTDLTVAHLLPDCPKGLAAQQSTCDALQSELQKTDAKAECTTNDGCWCKLTVPVSLTGTFGYTISGNNLVFQSGDSTPFCVQGDTLTLFTSDDGIEYRRGGKTCLGEEDCGTEHCCAQPDSDERRCQASACALGGIGAPCTTNAYCLEGRCADMHCAKALKALGADCASGEECLSTLCCPDGRLTNKFCVDSAGSAQATCPSLLGDPCSPTAPCSTGSCDLAPDSQTGFCTGVHNCVYYGEGIPDCGYNSNAHSLYCVHTSATQEECRPGCHGDADCASINTALHCFGYPGELGLCDYNTNGWLDPSPAMP
jgi:hypothetical protein